MILSENPRIEVFNEDCMQVMARYPDKHFDLAIVDPPYGIGEDGSKNKTRGKLATSKDYKAFSGNDNEAPDAAYFDTIKQKSNNLIIWGANHYLDNMPFNLSTPCWIVWDKDNGASDFADSELAWTSFKGAVRNFKWKWQGMLQQDMKNKETRIHPTQKPVALYKWLLKNYAKEGDLILDTHGGSGSILIACYEMGFDIVWTELDTDYYNAAIERFKKHIAQQSLFSPEQQYGKQAEIK